MSRVKVGDAVIEVVRGDITKLDVEAIVNPANSLMIMGGGVAGAIRRAGGEEIEVEAREKAPVPIGEAVVTGAGRLKCKYVIHSPTMEYPAMKTTADKVESAVRAALQACLREGIKEVAFPGMGTGVGGLDPQVAADIMVNEIVAFIKRKDQLRRVLLVGYDKTMYEAFLNAVSRMGK